MDKWGIAEISLNTEKSRGDLRRIFVTQTPVKKTSVNADLKNSQGVIIISKRKLIIRNRLVTLNYMETEKKWLIAL